MNNVPETVVKHLDGLAIDGELIGYLCIDSNQNIKYGAGSIGEFKLDELDRTIHIAQSIPFLEGLLLTKADNTSLISNVHIDDAHYFDIHIFNNKQGCWVLFIDNTQSGKLLQQEQQVRLDVDFINDKRKTGS